MADKKRSASVESKEDSKEGKKRRTITMETKLDMIRRSEKGESPSQIAAVHGVNRSTVATVVKDKDRILDNVKAMAPMQSTVITKKRSGIINEMERLLILWIETQNIKRRAPLSLSIIQEKARSLFEDLKKKMGDSASQEIFAASRGWFNRFKKRANLHNIKITGEAASANEEGASEFVPAFARICEEGNYSAKQVFNVDETALFWKKMPDRTYISKEEKSMPGFKAAKDRLTLLLGGNAEGDCKLKPLLVYHSENPRSFKGVSKSSLPVVWKSSAKAWVTGEIFKDWFVHHFVPEVKLYCESNNVPFNILLLLDNAPGHPVYLDDLNDNVKVVFLPPNTTALLQPMDQGVIRSFKAYYSRRTFSKALKTTEEKNVTLRDFWRGYNIYECVKNIGHSWNEVKSSNMNGVWGKVCPKFVSHTEDEAEDEFNRVTENIVEIANKLDLDLQEEDVEELVDSHSEDLSNEDLAQLVAAQVSSEVAEGETVETTPPKQFVAKEMADAFKKIDEALAVFERQDSDCHRFENISRGISNVLAPYKEIYVEKKKLAVQTFITSFFKKRADPTSTGTTARQDQDPSTPSSSTSSFKN